jgi:hypothetical protein
LYERGRRELEELGYTITGVVGDGHACIRKVFKDIPFQMCHVHMERLVIRGTTLQPKLEAGKALLAIVRTLHDTTMSEDLFRGRILAYKDKYFDFLHEKSSSPTTGEWWYTHLALQKSFKSLYNFFPYLFTYKKYPEIPRTTNTIEGHFSHVKDIVKIHRGIATLLLRKVLSAIFLASTIAPKKHKKNSK